MSEAVGKKRKSSDSGEDWGPKKMRTMSSAMEKLFNNDQCIRAIIAFLPLEDLAIVSSLSHSLKDNADIVFRTVHNGFIKLDYGAEHFSKQQIVFRQFGSLASRVELDMIAKNRGDDNIFHDDTNKVLRTIGHFCGANLKDLTLRGMMIDLSSSFFSAKDRAEIIQLLAMLTKISLMHVCIKSRFLAWARSVQELMIHSSCHAETLPEITVLPQLKVFSIGACPTWPMVAGDELKEFLRDNRSIEKVDYHFIVKGDGHLESICSLPKLTHLEIILLNCDDEDLSSFAIARKLKKLVVHALRCHGKLSALQRLLPSDCEITIKDDDDID
ncbi:hypothetical protein HA402_000011 [Bradysia odoriphaga]|nr:hypothetical protein HA402_000011 [Bradysia odoriphaga]